MVFWDGWRLGCGGSGEWGLGVLGCRCCWLVGPVWDGRRRRGALRFLAAPEVLDHIPVRRVVARLPPCVPLHLCAVRHSSDCVLSTSLSQSEDSRFRVLFPYTPRRLLLCRCCHRHPAVIDTPQQHPKVSGVPHDCVRPSVCSLTHPWPLLTVAPEASVFKTSQLEHTAEHRPEWLVTESRPDPTLTTFTSPAHSEYRLVLSKCAHGLTCIWHLRRTADA